MEADICFAQTIRQDQVYRGTTGKVNWWQYSATWATDSEMDRSIMREYLPSMYTITKKMRPYTIAQFLVLLLLVKKQMS